jgi:TPR repeat protein
MMARALLLWCCCLCGAAQADAATPLEMRGDGAAFDQVRHSAGEGDAAAAYRLGLMYRNGLGTARDSAQAAYWLERAAQRNVAPAMFILSNMLQAGEGVATDADRARRWLEAAAQLDYPEALQALALAETDAARAAQLMKEAAHAIKHRLPSP